MVTKINISIKEELLHEMDRVSRETHISRSALIAQAVEHLLVEREKEKEQQQRLKAVETIRKIADEIGPWDGTAEILKWREKH